MPLEFEEPPNTVSETIDRGLRGRFRQPDSHDEVLGGRSPGTLGIREPHRVFYLGLKALAEGAGLEAAEQTGWRVLVDDGERLVTTVDVAAEGGDVSGGAGGASIARSAKEAEQLESAFHAVEQHEFVRHHAIEPRLLMIPALYALALWLYEPANSESMLVPLVVDGRTVAEPTTWTADSFLGELQPKAQRHIEQLSEGEPA
jgi:hypothetical protein